MPKINQLPSASSATAADLFAIENSSGTATKHVSGQQIKDFVTADVNAEVTDLKSALGEINTANLWTLDRQYTIPRSTGIYELSADDLIYLPAGTYTLSGVATTESSYGKVRFCWQDVNQTLSNQYEDLTADGTRQSVTFTLSEERRLLRFQSNNTAGASAGYGGTLSEVQIETGSSATAYYPNMTAYDYLARSSVVPKETMPINVLLFGIKNDGTEDVSSKVNTLTETYSLYFPAGQYLVNNPITLKHSIYGSGKCRNNVVDSSFTWFISGINDPNTTKSVFSPTNDRSIEIAKINIKLNSAENGISVQNVRKYINIHDVNITNIGGFGIYCYNASGNSMASRLLNADSISLFGASDYPSVSIGISIGTNIGDCRVTNTEIMGTRIGMRLANGIMYMSDVHIWCGPLAGSDDGSWWAGTRGLDCKEGARLIATNLYLDTCYYPLYFDGYGGHASIKNFFYAEDSATVGSALDDSELVYFNKQNARAFIDGGFVNLRGDENSPCRLKKYSNIKNPNFVVKDVVSVSDYPITVANKGKYEQLAFSGSNYGLVVDGNDTDKYIEVAHIPVYNASGVVDFDVIATEKTTITAAFASGSVSVSREEAGSDAYYYKFNSTDGFILYLKSSFSSDSYISVSCGANNGQTIPVNYTLIRRRTPSNNSSEYTREILSSDSGLTLVSTN